MVHAQHQWWTMCDGWYCKWCSMSNIKPSLILIQYLFCLLLYCITLSSLFLQVFPHTLSLHLLVPHPISSNSSFLTADLSPTMTVPLVMTLPHGTLHLSMIRARMKKPPESRLRSPWNFSLSWSFLLNSKTWKSESAMWTHQAAFMSISPSMTLRSKG